MDARLDTYRILGLQPGDAHVIRNAGGVVTDDVIRSLVISQRLLGTREIMLVHHTDCGMQTFRDDDLKDAIEAETGLRPAFAFEAFKNLEQDVRESIARIQASPFVPHRDRVRGFVYDCASARLVEVAPRLIRGDCGHPYAVRWRCRRVSRPVPAARLLAPRPGSWRSGRRERAAAR